jgi:hypothetical protein
MDILQHKTTLMFFGAFAAMASTFISIANFKTAIRSYPFLFAVLTIELLTADGRHMTTEISRSIIFLLTAIISARVWLRAAPEIKTIKTWRKDNE